MSSAKSWKELFPKQAAALEKAKASHHVGQGYLFIGDSIDDLMTFARGWAQTAACTSPSLDGHACGQCSNCLRFQDGSYSEWVTIAPESKVATIKKENLLSFDHQMSLTVPTGMTKFGVVIQADTMPAASANAFLKTLEEPSSNVMFILLTTKPQYLLPTIRSRCQNILLKTNAVNYADFVPENFFEILATLYRGAGTKVALKASGELQKLFGALKKQAEKNVEQGWDKSMDDLAKGNGSLKKQLEELKDARIATEYEQLRAGYLDALQAWFRQRFLWAAGAQPEQFPQKEFLEYMKKAPKIPSTLEAEADLHFVETLIRSLRAKLPEDLCLDAFTLALCEIIR